MTETNSALLNSISERVQRIEDVVVELAKVQERQVKHAEAVERAWAAIVALQAEERAQERRLIAVEQRVSSVDQIKVMVEEHSKELSGVAQAAGHSENWRETIKKAVYVLFAAFASAGAMAIFHDQVPL